MSELIKQVLEGAKWKNKEFPSTIEWEEEHNKWLLFAVNQSQFDRFRARICSSEKDSIEAFAEISSAYYLCNYLNCKIIEWEPKGDNNKVGDYIIELPCETKIFCEVKSPGWEKDFVERKKFDRIKQPKYQNVEVNSYDNAKAVMYAIENSYNKYDPSRPNLLIIVDDFMVPNKQDRYFGINKALYATKLPRTHCASINKNWFSHCWDDVDAIWNELINRGYIDTNGIIKEIFNSADESNFMLNINFGKRHSIIVRKIFDVIRFQNFNGLFMNDRLKHLSALACLNVQQPEKIQYYFRVFDNHNAINRLPKDFITDTRESAFAARRR